MACAAPRTRSSENPFGNTRWRLVELGGRQSIGAGGERDAHLVFAQDSARISGSTGCNRLNGSYTREGAALRFGQTATTRMACLDPQLNQQEQTFLAALQATERYEIVRDTLTLVGAAGPLARLVAVR